MKGQEWFVRIRIGQIAKNCIRGLGLIGWKEKK